MNERKAFLIDLGMFLRTKEEDDELVSLMLEEADPATREIFSRLWPQDQSVRASTEKD